MKQLLLGLHIIILFHSVSLFSQEQQNNTLQGTVSFVTSSNIYVKFSSTDAISVDDVLQFNGTDCLKVTVKSSTSVVCVPINDCELQTGDTVIYTLPAVAPVTEVIEDNVDDSIPAEVAVPQTVPEEKETLYKEFITGRVSLASYNQFSDVRDDNQRLLGRVSLNANHIGGGKFSVETFLSYQNLITVADNYSGRTDIFNVYNLNVQYDFTPTLWAAVGRKINPKASVFGANDGLQVEKYFGPFYAGGIVGFRPDVFDYGFNSDLFQYGGYVGVETTNSHFRSTTTVGAMEQTNQGATDRRYLFFQHSSTIAKDLGLFVSSELDLFNPQGDVRLTNLYSSLRYRFSRYANIMVSYDSRKRIIYYETFQSQIDQILDDDLARQGFRARLNLRPIKYIWLGGSYSKRFASDQQNKSDNYFGYLTFANIPKVGGRLNGSYNLNQNNYLTSNIISVRYSRSLFKDLLYAEIYYRTAEYDYENQRTPYKQDYYGTNLNFNFARTWQFALSGEYSQFEEENNIRVYAQLTKRFRSKKNN
ncbi:hypothetical protein [Hanstruepera neustonica]|nr:hypothetical protein [Hanstruepera neustonica]